MSSTKRKAPPVRIAQPQTTRNAKPMAKARINESKTSVVSVPKHQQKSKKSKSAAGEAIEISSDESDNDEGIDEDDLMDEDEPGTVEEPKTNGHVNGTKNDAPANAADDNESNDDDDEDHEPTFGDLVREHETVDVTAALSQLNPDAAANSTDAAAPGTKAVAAPTLASLGHLLNAALRSGDDANLEVCFNTTTDAVWVRNTIQRLDPSLAGTLLQKLAARIHRRPGRAHTLVGWVQWTLITHGGALLANQAGVTRALQELHRVLEERARGLNSLLLLKGKLDMLEAQMQLRRIQRAGVPTQNGHSGVATVGGRSGSSKALDTVQTLTSRRGAGGRRRNGLGRGARGGEDDGEEFVATYREEDDVDEEDEEDAAGQILVNGAGVAGESFIADSDEEALDEDDDEDSEGDEDDDAEDDDLEEMDEDDAAEEDEIDFDDVDDEDDDDDEDDEDDAAAAPPPKLQKKSGGAFSKRR